jgi:hypothetical protein
VVILIQFVLELGDLLGWFCGKVFHAGQKVTESLMLRQVSPGDEASLLFLVLIHRGQIQAGGAEVNHRIIFFEKLGKINVSPALIGLLVKVNGPHAILHFLKVRSHVEDVIVAPHVAQESDETTLAEFHELLGNSDFVDFRAGQVIADENISWNTCDVLLNQCAAVGEVVDSIGGKQVLQFQTIDTGGVRHLHVKVVVVIIVLIHDPHPKWPGVSEFAKVHSLHKEVRHGQKLPRSEEGVNAR